MILKLLLNTQNDMNDMYKNIKESNPNKKRKILIILIVELLICLVIKKLNPIVTELFIRGRKLNISIIFITQSYFSVPKNLRLNATHYFIMKIPDKRQLQQIEFNHSSDIDLKDFMSLYKKRTSKPYSFSVIDATLASDHPLRFRKNLPEGM